MIRHSGVVVGLIAWVILLGFAMTPAFAQDGSQKQFDASGNVVEGVKPIRVAQADTASFDASGRPVAREKAQAAAAAAASQVACFELYNPSNAATKFSITVSLDPTSYPHKITGGNIKGTICGSPNWTVTGGSIGSSLTIDAQRSGGGLCASIFSMVGNFRAPASFVGTYGWNGASTSFSQTTLFLGYGAPCP